jgi:predicted TIM-barrel fold metal-dependent hydrolase
MRNELWRDVFAAPHWISVRLMRRERFVDRLIFNVRRCVCAYLLVAALCSVLPAQSPAEISPQLTPVYVDHHVHLNSPAIEAFLPDFCASISRFGKCDPALTAPHSVNDLLSEMARAGIRRALVMSDGYLAESPMMDPQRADTVVLLRAANDWTVGLARRDPQQFAAFIAVDPIRPTALPEIERWHGDPAVTGIKLHLTASGVDLRRDADITALAAVFRAAAEDRFAVMIHLRTQRMDYGAADVRRFVAEVLPAAGNTPVQIAHAGGWGGIDAATLSALGAFADAATADPLRFRHVWFDLSGVWTDKSTVADKQALVTLIRRIGPKHFLPASDWPYNGDDLTDDYNRVYPELPLTPREWAIIRSNVAPYARDRTSRGVTKEPSQGR